MEELSIKQIFYIAMRGKYIIIATIILSLISAYFFSTHSNVNVGTAQIAISFSYEGIEKGFNPDGSKFDINCIMSPALIQKALTDLELQKYNINVDSIRRNLSVEPILPLGVVEKIKSMAEEGKDYSYFPNQYIVQLVVPKSLGINSKTGTDILSYIIDSYMKQFNDLYSNKNVISNITGRVNLQEYDYPEISTIMKKQLEDTITYLNVKVREGKDFRSNETGYAFIDLVKAYELLSKMDMNSMDALIQAYNITKDKNKLIIKYQNTIRDKELIREKKQSEADISRNIMKDYEQQVNIVYTPDIVNSRAQLQIEDTYYDKLANKAVSAEIEAANLVYDIKYIKSQIQALQNNKVSEQDTRNLESQVAVMISSTQTKMSDLITITNKTLEEYFNEKLSQNILKLSQVTMHTASKLKLNLALALILGFIGGFMLQVFREFAKKSFSKKNNNETIHL